MNEIKFSKEYPKLWGQTKGVLLAVNRTGLTDYQVDRPVWEQQLDKIDASFIEELNAQIRLTEQVAEGILAKCKKDNEEMKKKMNNLERNRENGKARMHESQKCRW